MTGSIKSRKINGFSVYYKQPEELQKIYRGIFRKQEYSFEASSDNPFIIDGGSHIGLSVIYFKSRYPQAEIIAFEPDPDNFALLQRNVQENDLDNVTLINAALSNDKGTATLYGPGEGNDWTWANTIIDNTYGKHSDPPKAKVKSVTLSPYITKSVDLLKLDIEGAEQRVIEEIEPKLKHVKNIIMEYHISKTTRNVNNLQVIKDILITNNFDVNVVNEDLLSNLQSDIEQSSFLAETGLEVALVYAKRI